jgi:tyrosyl-tRNA synthetase
MTSAYELFQFWFNTSDASVIDYLRLFTLLSLEEIEEIERKHFEAPEKRIAQEILALEVVKFVHGQQAAQSAQMVMAVLFGKTELKNLSGEDLELLKNKAPKCVTKDEGNIVELLLAAELADSKREARTFVEEGAVFVNDTLVEDLDKIISQAEFGSLFILKRGKKKRVLVEIS